MSSPAGLQYSQDDFLAQWMPSSARAGVILNPLPDLAGSRHTSATGSPHLEPDDSFVSDFAPLPASADSSCLDVALGGQRAGSDSVPTRVSEGQLNGLHEMASKSQDLPLRLKLEQLRKWQQQMQEQLKAQQLEELLKLQEDQQRLLGIVTKSQHSIGDAESSGAEWDEDTPHRPSYCRGSRYSPSRNHCGGPRGSKSVLQQEQQLPNGQNHEEDEEEGTWNSRESDQEHSVDTGHFPEHMGVAQSEDHRSEDKVFHDRPIRPGIGGEKTFEEMLEEQLRLEEQRLRSAQQHQRRDPAAHPKRAFLKRGEGLSRFTNNRKASPKRMEVKDSKQQHLAKVILRSNSAPASIQNSVPRLTVQRKTAILNKENRLRGVCSPLQDVRAESKAAKTNILGSHQKQNTEGPQSVQTVQDDRQTKQHLPGQAKEQNNRKVGPSVQAPRNPRGHNMQPNPVTKQRGMSGGQEKAVKNAGCGSNVESAEGGDKVPQESFELSFQEKLQRWDCDRQLESMELGEFELLEQAAEELSFSSNSSFVMKVLQMDQQHQKLQAVKGLHQRRLSSTPIKSPPKGAPQQSSSVGHSSGLVCKNSSVNSVAFMGKIRAETLNDKVNPEDKEEEDSEKEDRQEMSDALSYGGPEFGHQDVMVRGTVSFPAPPSLPYDKHSYQDEDSFRDSASDGEQEDDGESVCDDSTLTEGGHQRRVVFDDDDTWNDLEETAISAASDNRVVTPVSRPTANRISPPVKSLVRKVAANKVVELEQFTVNPEPDPPPPASQLMTRLFPSLKPKAQHATLPTPVSETRKPEDETGHQVQSRQLRERLVELEIEIERFKKENAALTKLRQENEKEQENLRKERLDFEQTKAKEMAKFEEYKKEENRKLQKERKLFEKHTLAAKAMPDKKEREEILMLKQQLSSLQEDLRKRESRWTSTHSRLRQQIESLSQDNSSLQEEIRVLEKLRLSAWRKNAENSTERKDGPRIYENNMSSVSKGVTFASPLDSGGGGSSSPPQSSTAASIRRNCKDSSQGAAAMKSSLRKPGPSSTMLPIRKTEERSAPAKSQEKPPEPEHSPNCSPRGDSPKEAECSEVQEAEAVQEVITHPDGKTEKVLNGGDRLVTFPNGTRKEVSADGLTVKVTFFNGDTKEVTADQRVIYYYADAQTTHITYPDGMEVLHFPNNQTEKHFPDGRKEITFPDQTVKNLFPNGREESVLTDGTIIQVNTDGTKEIHFNTGQKEIHTADYKKREYPDGTVKTVYNDGRQETRYPTGRLRIKDKDGNVILDNMA
ncbi:centromere protein J [Parambassis ranga]|uniref:Centromere protein J n=1 Tax=Parambassis ranga TaxID=210632 RepID=A0A6P7H4F2_9TELE|nr:centromere protein J [Parambassis ranga]XP_028249263.1 centromere protein J [Parambassis ranga]